AALLGALPLAIGLGEGSELRRPLGVSIVGGLLVSQLLTLYTTPVVYLYFDRLRLWMGRRWRRRLPDRFAEAGNAGAPVPSVLRPIATCSRKGGFNERAICARPLDGQGICAFSRSSPAAHPHPGPPPSRGREQKKRSMSPRPPCGGEPGWGSAAGRNVRT